MHYLSQVDNVLFLLLTLNLVKTSIYPIANFFIHLFVFLQTHCWDDGTPLEETMKALNDLVVSGKVHYIGVSNVTGWQFQRIIDLCREKGYNQIVSNQVRPTSHGYLIYQ